MQIAYCNIFSIFQILAFTHKAYSYTAHTELYITYSKPEQTLSNNSLTTHYSACALPPLPSCSASASRCMPAARWASRTGS